MRQLTHLVIGMGEVGKAIREILDCAGHDREGQLEGHYSVLHICIPWSDKFEEIVRHYRSRYTAGLVVVHSTVPVGTCARLGAVHSPIRGVHPHLEEGIRTFVKYFGGEDAEKAAQAFRDRGLECVCTPDSKNTEALKLWDTEQYREFILLNQRIFEWCKERGVDFDFVYTQANRDYNKGYLKLGRPEVVRPYLKHMPGPIGGHCVEPNHQLLYGAKDKD